jgi:hypothetical protein
MWSAPLGDGACPYDHDLAGKQMPPQEFVDRHQALGFFRVDLEEGDVMLIERHRSHRVFGAPGSSAIAFAVHMPVVLV